MDNENKQNHAVAKPSYHSIKRQIAFTKLAINDLHLVNKKTNLLNSKSNFRETRSSRQQTNVILTKKMPMYGPFMQQTVVFRSLQENGD